MKRTLKLRVTAATVASLLAIVLGAGAVQAESNAAKAVKVEKKVEQKVERLEKLEGFLKDKNIWRAEVAHPEDKSAVILPNGNFRVVGVVVNSVNAGAQSLNVTFYGFTRDVNVGNPKVLGPANQKMTLAEIQPGDRLAATGNYNSESKKFTVEVIKDFSAKKVADSSARQVIERKIQELNDLINKLKAKLQGI